MDVFAVGLDAGYCEFLFGGREEPEAVVGLLREVDHPEVGEDADDAGDEALDQEHVLPAFEAAAAVEGVEAEVYDAACG